MYKVLQFNINTRKKQKVIKPKRVYFSKSDVEIYRYMIAKKYKLKSSDIYITIQELGKKRIIALKKSLNLKKQKTWKNLKIGGKEQK